MSQVLFILGTLRLAIPTVGHSGYKIHTYVLAIL
jgi:hypothetical protein